jgi:hypothetical protein
LISSFKYISLSATSTYKISPYSIEKHPRETIIMIQISVLVFFSLCCCVPSLSATANPSRDTQYAVDANYKVVMRPLTQEILRHADPSSPLADKSSDDGDSLLFMFEDKTFLFKLGVSESVESLQLYLEEVYGIPVEEQQVLLKPSASRKLAALDCIPTGEPSSEPSSAPSSPSGEPTGQPSGEPSGQPTGEPSSQPSDQPTDQPSNQPSSQPSDQPTGQPTGEPSGQINETVI